MSEAERGILAVVQALGLQASADQVGGLVTYLGLLQRWNSTYNLTAVRNPADMLSHHLADCLAVVPSFNAAAVKGPVLDVGSGAGLPGVVLAIFRPDLEIHCVDAVAKKAAFIRQVAGALNLPHLVALHARAESLPPQRYGTVTCRAFASLPSIVDLTRHQLAPAGVWMAMKGKVPDDEIAALSPEIEVFHVEHLDVPGLDAQRCLVWMRQRKPSA